MEAAEAAPTAAAATPAEPDFTPIGDIGSRHGETNDRGYSFRTLKLVAARHGVPRVNRHAFRQSGRVLGVQFKKTLRLASLVAARSRLKQVPVHPTLIQAAHLSGGVRVLSPQYHIRKQQ